MDLLEGYFLVRRLTPYHANVSKRLVKAPKIYLRDSGMLHYLLGINDRDALLTSPARGNSFEGFVIEQIAVIEGLHNPGSRCYFYRTHTGVEVDVVIDRGRERVGFEVKAGVAVEPRDWAHLKAALDEGVIDRAVLCYGGDREFAVADAIRVVPTPRLLGSAAEW
jgi:predicted AAA+ superfamily ATPase